MKTLFTTRTYKCTECGWTAKVRVKTPKGKDHHSGSFKQEIDSKTCMQCKLEKDIEDCCCGMCLMMGR